MTVCLVEAGPSDVGDDNILVLSRVDAPAGLRLRLGLPGRTAGARQLVHAARPRQGARRVFVAQLVHRVLAARRSAWTSGCKMGATGWSAAEVLPLVKRWSATTPGRSRPDGPVRLPRRATGRPVRRSGARGGRDGRAADGGVQPRRDRAQRRRLVSDQRGRGRHPHVDLARVPASDPRHPANLEVRTDCWVAEILFDEANGDSPSLRSPHCHRGALPAPRPDRVRHGLRPT